jgi:uncharacterized CHY-type Zn-finger protein
VGVVSGVNRLCYGLALMLLICPIYFPLVSASSDGASINLSTISLQDFQATEDDFYQLEFDIEVIGTPINPTSSGNISLKLATIGGEETFSTMQNFSLSTGSSITIIQNFTDLSYGYVVVMIELTGDVAFSNPTHQSSFQRTLQILKPLNISLGQSNEILLEGLDSSGQYTGNLSVNDGDYVQLQIPVMNEGDFDWNGTLTINVSDSTTFSNTTSNVISVPSMQTIIHFYNSSIPVHEGIISILIELNDSNDGYPSDERVSFTTTISPPPLPILSLILEEVTTDVIAGNEMDWNLSVFNSGDVGFDGNIICNFEGLIILNSSIEILANSNLKLAVSTTARPGILGCIALGERISLQSQDSVNLTLQVESAEFESAGGNTPAALLGPWHEGDDVRLSLLVRNHGSETGNVNLVGELSGVTYVGASIQLEVDQAGEVTVNVPLTSLGLQMINWTLQSIDGSIDLGLSGKINLSVADRQNIAISIPSVTWSEQEGLSFQWSVILSEGVNRDVRIRLGYIDSLEERYMVDTIMSLPAGQTEGSMDIGFVDAEKVIIRATEVNWVSGFGFSSLSLDIPQERALYSISFESQTLPNRPSFGDKTEVTINLENTGLISGSEGTLILRTSSGLMIEEREISLINSQTSQNEVFTITWPEGDEVSLVATWMISGQMIKAEMIFISSATQVEEESFEIPWSGMLGGIALASIIILVIRFRNNNSNTGKGKKEAKITKSEKKSDVSEIKIQVGCPECSRQLRIPSDYSGSVRCPDCTHSFEVEEKKDPTRESVKEDDSEPEVEEQEQQNQTEAQDDGKTEVACPECTQTLRIPSSYAGSVRCPACKSIFKAQ